MKISNVVATVNLHIPIDLKKISESFPSSEFSPTSSWLKVRLPPNNTYIAFYKSGKFLVTAKSVELINEIANRVLMKLNECNVNTSQTSIKIHNIVVSEQIELNASIEKIISSLDSTKASYEIEQFPALIYKDWGVTFLLFSNGKLILTGCKDQDHITELIKKFSTLIRKV
jgi:transcription initiation factor TFIID TATA-box-binding protein